MATWNFFLRLAEAPQRSAEGRVGDVTVRVAKGEPDVAVCDVTASSLEDGRAMALDAANAFLNTLSWMHQLDLQVASASWGAEELAKPGRHYFEQVEEMRMTTGLKIEVRDAATGQLVGSYDSDHLGNIEVAPSEAAAYFRRARVSTDLFDRFRNLYLVCELISDRIRGKAGKGSLQEGELLELGLTAVFDACLPDLQHHAWAANVPAGSSAVIQDVATFLYKAHRCELNHAKEHKPRKVPFNATDEEAVRMALPLMEFVARESLAYEHRELP
jgi:hypothetical protein